MDSSDSLWISDQGARRYRIKRPLGTGGEGRVYLCDTPVDAGSRAVFEVVVKEVARPELGDPALWLSRNDKLRHVQQPGLVRVRDVFLAGPPRYDDTPAPPDPPVHGYVVMDYLPGVTFDDWLHDAPDTPVTERLVLLTGIATALDALHEGSASGVALVHGDVKPSNVVINADGAPVLVDVEGLRTPLSAPLAAISFPYAAPELGQSGFLPTPASDRFAFYATVAHVLLGEVPPARDDTLDVDAVVNRLRELPSLAARHPLLEQLERALRATPEERPAPLARWLNHLRASWSQSTVPPAGHHSVASNGRSLSTWERLRPRPPRITRKGTLALAAAAVILMVGTANALTRGPTDPSHPSGDLGSISADDLPGAVTATRSLAPTAAIPSTPAAEPSSTVAATNRPAPVDPAPDVTQTKPTRPRSSTAPPTKQAKPAFRQLEGGIGNDSCGWMTAAKSVSLKYRGCVHHSVNGWYGGLEITNTGSDGLSTNLYITDWSVLPDGSDRTQASPGKWNAMVHIPAGSTVYVIGGETHPPTDRCVAVQGRPINTGTVETWSSTPFILANGAHCALPPDWSSPK